MRKIIALLSLLLMFGSYISAQSPRYKAFVNTGYAFSNGERTFDQWMINTAHGVEICPDHLFIGGGVGFGVSTESSNPTSYSLPVFADVRYSIGEWKVRPFIDIKAGYGFLWNDEYNLYGGFYFHPNTGICIPLSYRNDLSLGIAYTLHNAYYRKQSNSKRQDINIKAGGVAIMLGISF